MTTKTKSNISTIGWYQIIGGAIGAIIILYSVFNSTQFSALNISIYVFMLLFFAYSIFCGTLCLKHKDNALIHSLINQFLQLIGFAFFGFAFTYVAGLYLSIGLDLSNSIDMKFDVGISKFDFNINREHERAEINFNLVAFALIYWIDKLMKKIKEEKTNIEIASVGQS
jgi:hypothetical protein